MQSVTFLTVKYIFGKFLARYGSKWSSQYPAEMLPVVQKEWFKELRSLTIQDINCGLTSWKEVWPPNIVEFKRECLPAPYYRDYNQKALPAPVDKEKAREAILKLKEKLGIK